MLTFPETQYAFLLFVRHTLRFFFFSSRRRHTRYWRDWSSDVCSSDLPIPLSTIALILFSLQSKKNILKGIGQIGTGVLAGIGALDSGLNLYDRYMDSKNNTGGGAPSSNDKDKDKDKNKDKKDDNKKNAADNNNDSNKK